MNPTVDKKFQRGLAVQRERRAVEREVHTTVVACHRWLRGRGLSLAEAAQQLGVAPRTLAYWDHRWKPIGWPCGAVAAPAADLNVRVVTRPLN